MQRRRAHVTPSAGQSELADSLAALRLALGLPDAFPEAVRIEAERAAVAPDPVPQRSDLRELPFCTIDPAGSKDLDQALFIARSGAGFTLRYAIADVASYVTPGGAVDAESRRRGQTLYAPDARIPLYPPVLSEGAASLLADADRRAIVWTFALDAAAMVTDVSLERAVIRSVRQWSYPEAQAAIDAGTAPDSVAMLAEIGPARIALESERDGASLDLPEEEVIRTEQGYGIERRVLLPVEAWNAQVSLLTGMAAATIMLDGGIGILRTMPPADPDSI
ncbi:MAG: RNB domain-containing ribonuclease, partial [Leifsonia sp.]